MALVVKEVHAKSVLSRSGIEGVSYTVNPYTGCSHKCRYCYATFMKKYTGHPEAWGEFVDAKMNAALLLARQLSRAARGNVILSSVTDPYQRLEARYALTRACLVTLSDYDFPVEILTKSPLVVRDMDVITKIREIEVGFTITTDDDRIRRIFEPHAPSIEQRIRALQVLHDKGIRTYVFIGPVLPMHPEILAERIRPHVHRVMIDCMNYPSKTIGIYRAHRLGRWLDTGYVDSVIQGLRKGLNAVPTEIC
ncbi:MAG TPA: radical SAM protein [Syntrophorhabdales bacterium]|nr:radical SAM protein [Syntrophorhabdales bacterium]